MSYQYFTARTVASCVAGDIDSLEGHDLMWFLFGSGWLNINPDLAMEIAIRRLVRQRTWLRSVLTKGLLTGTEEFEAWLADMVDRRGNDILIESLDHGKPTVQTIYLAPARQLNGSNRPLSA